MTLDALKLHNTSGRLGGLQLLCLPAPWSARADKGYHVEGRVLVNLWDSLSLGFQLEIWAARSSRYQVLCASEWQRKFDLHEVVPEFDRI